MCSSNKRSESNANLNNDCSQPADSDNIQNDVLMPKKSDTAANIPADGSYYACIGLEGYIFELASIWHSFSPAFTIPDLYYVSAYAILAGVIGEPDFKLKTEPRQLTESSKPHYRTLDGCTYFQNIDRQACEAFKQDLKQLITERLGSDSLLSKNCPSKKQIFKISFLIKLAFELSLSFQDFRHLAHKAGYIFPSQLYYPPYYLLEKALSNKVGCEIYTNALTNISAIELMLCRDILKLDSFNKSCIQNYFLKRKSSYTAPYCEVLKDIKFQANFVSYFFRAFYIDGGLDEDRIIES